MTYGLLTKRKESLHKRLVGLNTEERKVEERLGHKIASQNVSGSRETRREVIYQEKQMSPEVGVT